MHILYSCFVNVEMFIYMHLHVIILSTAEVVIQRAYTDINPYGIPGYFWVVFYLVWME